MPSTIKSRIITAIMQALAAVPTPQNRIKTVRPPESCDFGSWTLDCGPAPIHLANATFLGHYQLRSTFVSAIKRFGELWTS